MTDIGPYEQALNEGYRSARMRLWPCHEKPLKHIERDFLYVASEGRLDEREHSIEMPEWRWIVSQVMRKHGLNWAEITSHRRNRKIVAARHEAAWRLSKETRFSLSQIGQRLGGFDHSTVIHAIHKHEERMKNAEIDECERAP